jgi:guanylate kinase
MPKVVVLSAPTGAGKTTIARALVTRRPDIGYSVSATTRAPRPGEADGVAYHFLTREEFHRRVEAGEFLEWAEYAGELYGTLRATVERELAQGRHVVMDIEVEGARQIRRAYPSPQSLMVFLLPPSTEVLIERLRRRKTEVQAVMARRLERAVEELREVADYDYVVINDELEPALAEIERLIDGAGGAKADGAAARLRALGDGLAREAARLKRQD